MSLNLERSTNYLGLVANALAAISILAILLNCVPTFFWGDDFGFQHELQDKNLVEFVWQKYFHWDGRHLTLGGLIQSALIKFTNAPVATFVWAFSLIICSYSLSKCFNIKHGIIPTGLISASLIVLFKSHAFQTVFWSTGGFYSFNLLLLGFWLQNYVKMEKLQSYWHLYILSFLLGMTTQNLVVSLLLVVGLDCAFRYRKSKKIEKELVLIFMLMIPGAMLITFAPGNQFRLDSYPEMVHDISALINACTHIYHEAFLSSLLALPFAAIFSLYLYRSGVKSKFNLQHSLKFFIASLASLTPFIFISLDLFSTRTLIYFQFFFFLSLVYFFSWVVDRFRVLSFAHKTFLNPQITATVIILQLLGTIALSTINVVTGTEIKKQVKTREAVIYSYSTTSDVVVDRVVFPWGYSTYMHLFWDLQNDTTKWPNSIAAQYYGVKSIRTKE